MSLAMYAAPFEDSTSSSLSTPLNKKRQQTNLNKTQKQHSSKVNSMLQTIHNLPPEEYSENGLSDFNPIPPPSSAGVENTKIRENMTTKTESDEYTYAGINHSNIQKFIPPTAASSNPPKDYYSRFMPNYDKMYSANTSGMQNLNPYQNQNHGSSDNDILLNKLNYMINLLEQSQDERTNNVTEEIVLYIFLGIFIIFIIDSFVRVGKYVR